ncbi:MAG: c-type cytochrome, partial [Acidobacteriia bacterium]|nr:c-type cytochrome [Terriglobia bacterium]
FQCTAVYDMPMRLLRLICPLLIVGVALFAQEKGKKGPSPFEHPTNLKLLKPDNLRETMQNFSASLGVMCAYCHVQGNFPSDDNPKKETARMMISMAREINAKFPDGQQHVRCYTCHRGMTEPATEAPKAN